MANSDAKLYDDEFNVCLERFPGQFRVDYALSREAQNKNGGKMYIQDKVRTRGAEVCETLVCKHTLTCMLGPCLLKAPPGFKP